MQAHLFDVDLPHGVYYEPAFVSLAEERVVVAEIQHLAFSEVVLRGVAARRRTAHFGWNYTYQRRRGSPGMPIPGFLLPLRARAAEWAGLVPSAFAEALVTEYPAGAAIGWHRDAPMFGDVIAGISLLAWCRMRFRPYVSPADVRSRPDRRTATHEIELAPRSAYLITGTARTAYEHSIPAVPALRYSITFRTLR